MHPKDADGMSNSVDPDQTASSEAVWSWSALFAETYLSQYIDFVRYVCLLFTLLTTIVEQKMAKQKHWPRLKEQTDRSIIFCSAIYSVTLG